MVLLVCSTARAQRYIGSTAPRRGSVEASASVLWAGGYDAGSQSAVETSNSSNSAAPGLTLFTTSSRVRPSPGIEGRIGVYLSARLAVEGALQIARPVLESRLGDDFEGATPTTADTTVTSYIGAGSLLYHFGRGQLQPFVSGGGGYLRQLSEHNAEVVTGSEIHAGGGVKYWFQARRRHFGLRGDAQASWRSKPIGFEAQRRVVPVVSGGLVYLF
jgi:hypothetical protein